MTAGAVMKTKPVLFLAGALLALACRGNDGKAVRKDQQYDVVQEGQASGVTSTINGPGEPAPVASAPLSGTNADTTTNLALPTDSAGNVAQGQPGTLASTLPATGGAMATPAAPPAMPPAGASPRPRVVTSSPQPAPRPMTSSSTVTPAARPAPQQTHRTPRAQPATDTQAAPPPTDTTTTQPPATDTKPPKDSSTKSEARPEKEKTDTSTSPQPAPPTDPQPPPPPPPVV
jgi:hypothetical protein